MFSKTIFMMMVTGEREGRWKGDRKVYKIVLVTHERVREERELYSSPTIIGGDSAW